MSRPAHDIAFPLWKNSDPEAWGDLRYLFLSARPKYAQPGATVWLRHIDRFVWSYQVAGVVELEARVSEVDRRDFGPGPALLLQPGSARRRNRILSQVADPDGVGATWKRGWRYLSRGARAFVRVGGLSTLPPALPRFIPPDAGGTQPVPVVTRAQAREASRVEAALVHDFVKWRRRRLNLELVSVSFPATAHRGSMRADLYDHASDCLIEAKSISDRDHLRLAIGQLYDYSRAAIPPAFSNPPALAVLVPDRPNRDLMELLRSADIHAIWQSGQQFRDSHNNRFTG